MESFAGISHEDLLKLVLSFGVLLGAARLFGAGAKRLGLPAVVGELMAGIVVGPSVVSGVFPVVGRWIIPATNIQFQLLDAVSLFGVMLLLIVIGLETDLGLVRSRGRVALAVGLGGLVVPFIAGILIGLAIPDDLLVDPARRKVFALFLAVALALSAIPVLAKVLSDMDLLKTPFGQSSLAAGMIDDIIGWTLLGIVTSLAAAGGANLGNAAKTVAAVVIFFAATYLVARPFVRISLRFLEGRSSARDAHLTLIVVACFLWGAFSHALHLEPVLGAFAMAVIFGHTRRLPVEVGRHLESVTFGVFAPVFLAIAGLRLTLDSLGEGRLIVLTLILLAVAAAAKVSGAYIGARLFAKTDRREALAYGLALNARGVLGIIVATLGLNMGILGNEVYAMVVLVSLATSVMAPIGLRLVFGRIEATQESDSSPLGEVSRVLIAVRPDLGFQGQGAEDNRALEASVLTSLGLRAASVTLFSVGDREARTSTLARLQSLASLFPAETTVDTKAGTGDPATAILEEAARGYDLVAMGAPAGTGGDHLFGSVVDEVVRMAPCPSLLFLGKGGAWPPSSILVPTGGSRAASRAADLAFAMAGDAEVILYHVVDPDLTSEIVGSTNASLTNRLGVGHEIVSDLRDRGGRAGVAASIEVASGGGMVETLLDRMAQGVDLVVIGTDVRVGTTRLFLGPKVERLLAEAPCSVVLLNS